MGTVKTGSVGFTIGSACTMFNGWKQAVHNADLRLAAAPLPHNGFHFKQMDCTFIIIKKKGKVLNEQVNACMFTPLSI